MNETETQVAEVTTEISNTGSSNDEWTIDVSDIMPEVEETPEAEQTEETEDAAPDDAETDQPEQTDGDISDKETSETEVAKETDQFTLKHLGEEVTKSREEVIALAQKGLDYDRVRTKYDEMTSQFGNLEQLTKNQETISLLEELAKDGGFKNSVEMLEDVQVKRLADKEGMTEAEARRQIAFEKKDRELKAREAKLAAQNASETKRNTDFKEWVDTFKGVDPATIPKEVWEIYNKGNISLVQATKQHKEAQAQAEKDAEIAKLKAELETTKKATENKQRSTGSRSTVGNTTKEKDPFLAGWNS